MRRLAPLALSLLLAAGAYAQRGGFGGGGRGGGGMGRGGGFVHGGGGRGGFGHGGFARGGFVHGGFKHGGFVRGHAGVAAPFGFGFHTGFHNPFFFGRTFAHNAFFTPGFGFGFNKGFWGGGFGVGGWGAWPIYVGGVYTNDPFYSYPYYPSEPNITVIGAPYAAQPAPPVVITQAYQPAPQQPQPAQSSIREYGPAGEQYGLGREPARTTKETAGSEIYLLALKDGVIRAALAYWVDGGTLHYVGTDRKNHQVPLASVNRDFSAQLNRERGVSFRLPAP